MLFLCLIQVSQNVRGSYSLISNPFGEFRKQCEHVLRDAINKLYKADYDDLPLNFEIPPSVEFGELATTICFEISKKTKNAPSKIASKIADQIDLSNMPLIEAVKEIRGYLNFHLNYPKLIELTLNSVRNLKDNYGFVKTALTKKIIVEHSSFNPIHAIHIGQARSPVIGDAIYRMLRKRGHETLRHFYIDDTGRQSAIIAYGYKLLRMPEPSIKPDHFMGQIYSIMNCLLEITRLKNLISGEESDKVLAVKGELEEWTEICTELEKKHSIIFKKLKNALSKEEDLEYELNTLLKDYEEGKEAAKRLIRKVSDLCIKGFKQTLARMEVYFDSWDWESDLIWSNRVKEVLKKLQKTKYISRKDKIMRLEAERVIDDLSLRSPLGISEDYEIPPVILTRSDGTTLYVTRDIAYSLYKFELVDEVINVIGAEQNLAQLQVKVALNAMGFSELALKQHHFAFGLVEFPQFKMSSRRGRIISLDQVIDEAVGIAFEKVSEHSKIISKKEKGEIANRIAIGAIKYALLSIEPSKNVTFTWDRVLNLKRNSAPFINYAFTRTCGILRKSRKIPKQFEYSLLKDPLEHKIVFQISRLPEIFIEACENLRPDIIANFANLLAETFHEYYEKIDVTHVKDKELRLARVALVNSIQTVLQNAMSVLGIELTEKM